MANDYDWKSSPKGFPYKGVNDPKYIKDRNELFQKNGNGWWWYQGTKGWREYYDKNKENQKRRL